MLGQFDGYRDTEGVADDSTTDTFVAARLWIDTDRWRGVPFLLRTGKQLAQSRAAGQPDLPHARGRTAARTHCRQLGNVLTVSLSGSGAIDLRVVVKEPGAGVRR